VMMRLCSTRAWNEDRFHRGLSPFAQADSEFAPRQEPRFPRSVSGPYCRSSDLARRPGPITAVSAEYLVTIAVRQYHGSHNPRHHPRAAVRGGDI
jgi:hypothetical protein